MKTVENACIGGMNFHVENDAYQKLDSYLKEFSAKSADDAGELMEDVELRIADLFREQLENKKIEVVSIAMVEEVINRIGMPDGSSATSCDRQSFRNRSSAKKFYRDPDEKKIAGVCSGLAIYLDVDVTIIRVVFLVALFCGSAGFWLYIIFWIISPQATTAAQKCNMRGIEANAENMKKYSSYK